LTLPVSHVFVMTLPLEKDFLQGLPFSGEFMTATYATASQLMYISQHSTSAPSRNRTHRSF
jgi:hypothetical protein